MLELITLEKMRTYWRGYCLEIMSNKKEPAGQMIIYQCRVPGSKFRVYQNRPKSPEIREKFCPLYLVVPVRRLELSVFHQVSLELFRVGVSNDDRPHDLE